LLQQPELRPSECARCTLSLSLSLLSLSYPNAVFSITSPRTVHFVTTKSAAVVSSVVAPHESRMSAAISITVVAPADARQPLQKLLSVFFFSQRFSAGFFFFRRDFGNFAAVLQQLLRGQTDSCRRNREERSQVRDGGGDDAHIRVCRCAFSVSTGGMQQQRMFLEFKGIVDFQTGIVPFCFCFSSCEILLFSLLYHFCCSSVVTTAARGSHIRHSSCKVILAAFIPHFLLRFS
jgi:hypothetical protein